MGMWDYLIVPLHWSTRDFAEDFLWVCKRFKVPVEKAMKEVLADPWDNCPVIMVQAVRCQGCTEKCKECKFNRILVSDAPNYNHLSPMWNSVKDLRRRPRLHRLFLVRLCKHLYRRGLVKEKMWRS